MNDVAVVRISQTDTVWDIFIIVILFPFLVELTEEQKTIARKVFCKWETYRFFSLKDDLYSCAAMLKEANAISTELKKQVTFQFTILTDTPYSPIPFSVATSTDVDIDSGETDFALDNLDSPMIRERGPMVAIEVKDSKHGATHHWSMTKFE